MRTTLTTSVALCVPLLLLPLAWSPQDDDGGTSGAPILPEETAYDVLAYALDLKVDPASRTIEGVLGLTARVVRASDSIVLALDQRLQVRSVKAGETELEHRHRYGRLRITAPELFGAVGSTFEVAVAYGGKPREAPNPPWDGGFTWARTPSGAPWIATSCQGEGADLWWPCKDQPSDEPDEMHLRITVPVELVVASNGHLVSVKSAGPGWHTYEWHVSTPINNYTVALNIAPYETLHTDYESVSGDVFPVTFWVLPENLEKGRAFFPELTQHLRFFEELFGPYPFRADKYGVAETPHLGMEHQTIIAYGNEYKGNPWGEQWGFDALHHHELSHEWWGNLVTCANWKDMWIHEGFGTYCQSLYVEKLHGREAFLRDMASKRHFLNRGAVAPRQPRSSSEMYFEDDPNSPGGDIYNKGAWILHTLRWYVGDEAFFQALRRMAYPSKELEATVDGSACRLVDTEEFRRIAEEASGMDLAFLFEVYLRQPKLPILSAEAADGTLHLAWRVPQGLDFPLPLPVQVGDELRRVDMPEGEATLEIGDAEWKVDPEGWILRAE